MYLRRIHRNKNGKEHSYWSIVESRRRADGPMRQRHVLYLGEINDAQERAWARAVEVFPDETGPPHTRALFPEERLDPTADEGIPLVRLRLKELSLHRQWFGHSALADLLGVDGSVADPHKLYGCHDQILAHKSALSRIWCSGGGTCSRPSSTCSCTI